MKFSICYSSLTGNTKKLAECIYETLNKEDCVYFGPINDNVILADKMYIGFWTDKGTCDKKTEMFLKSLNNKEVFLFGTAGFGVSEEYFEKIISRATANLNETNKIISTFMCQGKMQIGVRKRYEKIKEVDPKAKNIDMLIKNFDMALTHPDNLDLANLKAKLK